jgi:hypothetical protein
MFFLFLEEWQETENEGMREERQLTDSLILRDIGMSGQLQTIVHVMSSRQSVL